MLAVADYDGLRKETAAVFDAKVGEVKDLVSKLQKTQKAVEQALDQYEKSGVSGKKRAEQSINGETLEWKVGKERLGKRANVREIHGYHSVVINILQ